MPWRFVDAATTQLARGGQWRLGLNYDLLTDHELFVVAGEGLAEEIHRPVTAVVRREGDELGLFPAQFVRLHPGIVFSDRLPRELPGSNHPLGAEGHPRARNR